MFFFFTSLSMKLEKKFTCPCEFQRKRKIRKFIAIFQKQKFLKSIKKLFLINFTRLCTDLSHVDSRFIFHRNTASNIANLLWVLLSHLNFFLIYVATRWVSGENFLWTLRQAKSHWAWNWLKSNGNSWHCVHFCDCNFEASRRLKRSLRLCLKWPETWLET